MGALLQDIHNGLRGSYCAGSDWSCDGRFFGSREFSLDRVCYWAWGLAILWCLPQLLWCCWRLQL